MSKVPSQRPHFVRSVQGLTPRNLNIYLYKLCNRTGRLIYDESHQQGQPVSATDLRYWGNISSALQRFHSEGFFLKKINLAGNSECTDSVVSLLQEFFLETLEDLNIQDCTNISTDGLLGVGRLCNLTSLNIGGVDNLTDSDVQHLTSCLEQLKEINISHSSKLTNVSLQRIAYSPFRKKLKSLKCTHNTHFTQEGMHDILSRCDKLLTLDISYCPSITHIGIINVVESTYGFNEKPMKQYVTALITHLTVAGCPLREEALDWIGSALPDLRHLDVAGLPKVSNGFIQAVSLGCSDLSYLDIKNCKQIDSSAVLLVAGCSCRSNLLHIDLSYLGAKKLHSVAIMHVLENCSSLMSLDVSGNSNLTDDMFAYMPAVETGLRGAGLKSSLRKFCMQGCAQVTSTGVKKLASLHTGLEELNICGLSQLDNNALVALGIHCQDLRMLKANDCLGLSGEGLEFMVQKCFRLIELHIGTSTSNTDAWGGRVVQYSDRTLRAILLYSRQLRVLDMRNQCGISMSSGWLNGQRGDRNAFCGHVCLQKIDLFGCDKLSPAGMVHVLSKCFNIEDVTLPSGSARSGVSEEVEREEVQRTEEAALSAFKSKRTGPSDLFAGMLGRKGPMKQTAQVKFPESGTSAVGQSDERSADGATDDGISLVGRGAGSDIKESIAVGAASRRTGRGGSSLISSGAVPAAAATANSSSDHPKDKWMSMFKFCRYATNSSIVDKQKYFWGGLYPHPLRKAWYYRDSYIRRQMDEQWAARKIQYGYRTMIWYRRLKTENTVKYLQRWYRGRVIDGKMSLIRDRLYIIECAKKIQRNFKNNLLPLLRNVVLVQRIVRGWKGRTTFSLLIEKHRKAAQIQKMVRGMLVRLSDAYILAQIYVKLPPFWKAVIHSCSPEDGDQGMLASLGSFSSKGEYSERVKMYQITKKKHEVQDMIRGIESNRTVEQAVEYASSGGERKFNLAPKLPFIVPQAFDKNPYVSRADGRKLAFFGDQTSLFLSESSQKSSTQSLYASKAALTFGLDKIATDYEEKRVHQYTFTFWPMQGTKDNSDADTTLFDPMLNGFDVRQNMKLTLHCELCGLRLRLIHCKQCVKGFCFFCAFKAHVDGSKRNHAMDMIEPRVVHVKESSQSLVYHMDMVQKATYDIKYLVNFLKSTAEIQRIQKERNLAKEMEELEAKRAIESAKAAQESQIKHMAATKIANMFRKRVAAKYVKSKGYQKQLEDASFLFTKATNAATKIQCRFRVYSVRKYFQKVVGVKFRVDFKRKKRKAAAKKLSAKEEARRLLHKKDKIKERVLYDVQQRRLNDRNWLFGAIVDEYANACQTLEANIHYWTNLMKTFPPKIEALKVQRRKLKEEHRQNEIMLQAGLQTLKKGELFELNAKVKGLFLKRGACTHRIEHFSSMRWWITHHIRGNCRRLAVIRERFKDTVARVRWLVDEDFVISRCLFHLRLRRDKVAIEKRLQLAAEWFTEYSDYAETLRAKLDAMQETVLTEEKRRIGADLKTFRETDSLMMELINAMRMDGQYAVERVALDTRAFVLTAGSDEAVSVGDRSLVLKMKQQRLMQSVLDPVKMGLDGRFEDEENRYLDIAAFPTDNTDLEPEDMFETITATIVDRHTPKRHFEVKALIDVLNSQPWMAKQAIEDVHLEEKLRSKELALDRLQANVTAKEKEINANGKAVAGAKQKIADIDLELTVLSTEKESDHDPDVWEEMMLGAELMQSERNRLEAEIRLQTGAIERGEEMLPLMKDRVDVVTSQLAKMKEALSQRNAERKEILDLYFSLEEGIALDMRTDLLRIIQQNAKQLAEMREHCRQSETAVAREVPAQLVKRTADFETQVLLNESNFLPKYELQECTHNVQSRTNSPGIRLAELGIEVKTAIREANIQHFAFREKTYTKEEEVFSAFPAAKKFHEERMQLFLASQLNMRRQHALQNELNERQQRLNDMREIRLAAIKEAREKALEAERIRKEEEEAKAKVEKKTLTQVVAENIKGGIRTAADDYRKMKERRKNGLDAEEERMAHYMRIKKGTNGGNDGIRKIKITASVKESEQFQRQNDILASKGFPYYRMMERGIGTSGDVFLWFEMTPNPEDFITHIELAHADRSHPLYKELDRLGYEKIENPLVKLVIFVKRDRRRDKALKAIRVSYEASEESRFMVDGYSKISDGVSLLEFGFPDIFLWSLYMDKDDKNEAANVNALIGELKGARKMLKHRPGDKDIQNLVKMLEEKLDAAYHQEVNAEVSNPLEYAVNLMALSNSEVKQFMKIFQSIDREKEARITTDQLFEWLGEPPTKFNMHMIHSLDALAADNTLEFGDFLRTFAVFCFFGSDEILRLCFTFADTESEGEITHASFVKLLNQLHPFDKTRTKRALAELDLSPDRKMGWEEFKSINGTLPTLLYPAFRFQHTMRVKTMGEDWWLKKLRKYKSVRQKLKGSKMNADDAAEREMQRVKDDDERAQRMKDRAVRIAQTGSAIERVILNARQIADEFS